MILTWFNEIDCKFRSRYYKKFFHNYYVGFRDSYGYEVVQILYLRNNKVYNCVDFDSFVVMLEYEDESRNNKLLKSSVCSFLDKIRARK